MKLLLDPVVAMVRAGFTKQEVLTVQAYGGAFNASEIDQVSYACPAIFVTVLGWQGAQPGAPLAGPNVRDVRLAAFVATKHAKRELRLEAAMLIADKLALLLRNWRPELSLPADYALEIAPLDAEPSADNLYSRATDEKGQAVWMVDWQQCVQAVATPGLLVDWLTAEIRNLARASEAAAPAPQPLPPALVGKPVVTDEIIFANP